MKNLFLFDFDGTISNRDSTKYYFMQKLKLPMFILGFYILPVFSIIKFIIFGDNYNLKVTRVRYCLILMKLIGKDIKSSAEEIDAIVYDKAKDFILNLIKDQSSDIYIVSASWNFILNEWAVVNKVGLICNEMIYNRGKIMVSRDFDCDKEGKYILIYENILNLREYDKIIAYGNSVNDFNMFMLADEWIMKPFKD